MRFRNRPDVQTRLGEILMTGRNLLLTRPATDTPRLTEARRPGTRAADLCGPGSGGCRPPGGRHVPGKPFACQTPPESRPAWGEWRCFTCHETYWFGPGLCRVHRDDLLGTCREARGLVGGTAVPLMRQKLRVRGSQRLSSRWRAARPRGVLIAVSLARLRGTGVIAERSVRPSGTSVRFPQQVNSARIRLSEE